MEEQNPNRKKMQFGLATFLAILAITCGLLTTLMNTGIIDLSLQSRHASQIQQWEQIRVHSSRDAMKIWQQVQTGGTMSALADQQALEYELVEGHNLSNRLKSIREQLETTGTGALGPIVNSGGSFYVTRVTQRNDPR